MRFLRHFCCIVLVAGLAPAFAQNVTLPDSPTALAEAPPAELPPGRVGRVSLVSGNAELRTAEGAGWAAAEVNAPVFSGEALRTDPRARGEIEIGANTIALADGTEIEVASLRDRVMQIELSRGRIGLHLRGAGEGETAEVDLPQGGIWLAAAGRYDIEAGDGDQPPRLAVFAGTARFAGAEGDLRIDSGRMAVLPGSEAAATTVETAPTDSFVQWCREHDYNESTLPAIYYVSPETTGFAQLDAAGVWKIDPEYGPVWFPTASDEWAPYRSGHWSWIQRWGWTWIDDQPWAFAPSHYGRWAMIHDHWAWVPGRFTAQPLYAPAVVAFLGTPGIGLSSKEGATVTWFPLAPEEAYWPAYARDIDYVRRLNRGNVQQLDEIRMPESGEPPLELFDETFANRQYATAVPRTVFINGRAVASARITLPERRLQNAPVLMASPQIEPASPQRIARAANPPPAPVAIKLSRSGGKLIRAASIQAHGHGQAVIIRGAHLRAPSYAGPTRGRQTIVLHVAHVRGGPGKRG